jgi:hypothetical protein
MLDNMNKSTIILHESLIRAVKGMVSAWEKWIFDIKKEQNI